MPEKSCKKDLVSLVTKLLKGITHHSLKLSKVLSR